MLSALLLSTSLIALSEGVQPPDYSERGLCDLWAGALCHMRECQQDAKEHCQADSKRCRSLPRAKVPPDRATKLAECARAMLKLKCGDPMPPECADVQAP
jgi:hypothetical protein